MKKFIKELYNSTIVNERENSYLNALKYLNFKK